MIIPAIISSIGIAAAVFGKDPPKPVDPVTAASRRAIYEAALNSKDPIALRKVAAAFREQGCIVEADMLDKRIAICEQPDDLRRARREAFRKLMCCTDPKQVRSAAITFADMGCTGAAANLNRYAQGLEDAAKGASNGN